jgi:hypothetical protein
VEVPKTAPWIPGQQLYGAMIPRPEREATLYIQEALRQKKRLVNLELLVKKSLRTGVPKSEGRKLIKMGEDTNLPSSLGYEIAAAADHEEPSREEEVNCVKHGVSRILVVLSDDDGSFNLDPSDRLVLESDGTSTYTISPNCAIEEPEEEGVEIVGLGRLNTLCEAYDDYKDLLHHARSVEEDDSSDADAGLSLMYQASERVHVGFYRPSKKLLEGSVSSTAEEQIEGRISEDITFV